MTVAHKRSAYAQLAHAGIFLESASVVHADLSCRNVLLCWMEDDPRYTIVKMTDFGLAVVLPPRADSVVKKQPQATRWCAPESVSSCKLSHRADVWSLGTTFWEIFAGGEAPWTRRKKRSEVAARLRDLAENGGAAEGGADVSRDFPPPEVPMSRNGTRSVAGSTVHGILLSCLRADEYARPTFAKLA